MSKFPKDHQVKLWHNNGKPIRRRRVGRNELCECGSGRKVKNCCLEKQIVNSKTGQVFNIKNSYGKEG